MANEKRLDLIDRQALGIGRCNPDAFPLQNRGYVAGWNGVIDLLEQAPRVDAVEVVHAVWVNVQNGKGCCSNCHRLDSIDNLATHCRYCGAKIDICEIAENIESCEDCGFCSYGERREGE